MFDPVSNSIDNLSGLSIARYTEFMTLAATHPDVSERQRKNFINIATRKVVLAGFSQNPNAEWMKQTARNLSGWGGELEHAKYRTSRARAAMKLG